MVKAVERAHAIGADALQIFADNPTSWRRRAEPPAELPEFLERADALGIGPIAVHAAYLVNLAGPDDQLFEQSVTLLAHELEVAPAFGARFVNVHVGSHKGTGPEAGIARLATGLARVLDAAPDGAGAPLLVLENSAGAGGGLGTSVDELARILDAVARLGAPDGRLAFCLDTAHAWAAGIDLGTAEGVDAALGDFDARIGLDRLAMVHLNDSWASRGSFIDRHQHLGAGQIGVGGLARLLTHPGLSKATFYLETPGMDEGYDAVNVARAHDIAAGRPLADLPPEALELRGTRARAAPE